MITTVTGKNQITIPAELARELDIAPGTRFDWAKGEAGGLIVKIIPNRAELARRLAGRGRTLQELLRRDGVDRADV